MEEKEAIFQTVISSLNNLDEQAFREVFEAGWELARQERDQLKSLYQSATDVINELMGKNTRYEKALERIAYCRDEYANLSATQCGDVAQEALNPEKSESK